MRQPSPRTFNRALIVKGSCDVLAALMLLDGLHRTIMIDNAPLDLFYSSFNPLFILIKLIYPKSVLSYTS